MFGDVLQQVMEAELDTKLGYEKSERVSNDDESSLSKNYRNGHSKKTVKTQLGEVTINVPRDRNGEYEPSIISKYSRNADGMEEKNTVAVLMRNESAGYFRADKKSLRCRNITRACQ